VLVVDVGGWSLPRRPFFTFPKIRCTQHRIFHANFPDCLLRLYVAACLPFGPCFTSKLAFCFSCSDLEAFCRNLEKCANTSSRPSSGAINRKPFASWCCHQQHGLFNSSRHTRSDAYSDYPDSAAPKQEYLYTVY
jgi:hypothetical protein